MPSHLSKDPQRTEIFFALHHDMLRYCAANWCNHRVWQTNEGKRLLSAARTYFEYSSTTVDMDIMRTLVKHFDPRAVNLR